jgi:type III secretion system FlhB-like substrate exporter
MPSGERPVGMEKAAALSYREELPAPIVVAAGRGALAEAIRRIAEENGVAIVEDPALADALLRLDLGELIPESLYAVVAEILVFVGSLGKKR